MRVLGIGDSTMFGWDVDPHPNARPHGLVADRLYESLAQAGIWSELEMNLTARQGNETS